MKIGFDVSQTAEDMAGCGFFSKQMISHILEQDKKMNMFSILSFMVIDILTIDMHIQAMIRMLKVYFYNYHGVK